MRWEWDSVRKDRLVELEIKKLVGLENHQTGGNRTGYVFRAKFKFVEWI